MVPHSRISEVIAALGGPEVIKGRCRAWYRDGKSSTSLSIDDERGVWFDHGTARGGGVVRLVEVALDVNRQHAFDWLRKRYGIAKPDPAMRTRRQAVRSTANELANWRWRLTQGLRAVAIFIDRDCRAIARWTDGQTDFGDDPRWELFSRERERLAIAEGLDVYVRRLLELPAKDVLRLRRRLECAR